MNTDKEYKAVLSRLNNLVKKGEANLTKEEIDEMRRLAVSLHKYEKSRKA